MSFPATGGPPLIGEARRAAPYPFVLSAVEGRASDALHGHPDVTQDGCGTRWRRAARTRKRPYLRFNPCSHFDKAQAQGERVEGSSSQQLFLFAQLRFVGYDVIAGIRRRFAAYQAQNDSPQRLCGGLQARNCLRSSRTPLVLNRGANAAGLLACGIAIVFRGAPRTGWGFSAALKGWPAVYGGSLIRRTASGGLLVPAFENVVRQFF